MWNKFLIGVSFGFLTGLIGFIAVLMFSCTYNISMAHTEGAASDVIDDTQSPQNTVSPNLVIPAV